jgi:hypothetical protein
LIEDSDLPSNLRILLDQFREFDTTSSLLDPLFQGEKVELNSRLIPKMRHVVENYRFQTYGGYSAWPRPNSNTFVQPVLDAVAELKANLPLPRSEKIILRRKVVRTDAFRHGSLCVPRGYLGITIGQVEGFEFNFLGAVVGFDIRRPALKFPGIGRLGMTVGI